MKEPISVPCFLPGMEVLRQAAMGASLKPGPVSRGSPQMIRTSAASKAATPSVETMKRALSPGR